MNDQTDTELGYADALAELESTLGQVDDDDLDIDVLGTQVERAAMLIQLCRDRIGAARVQVERIVADLGEIDDNDPVDE